MTTTPQHLPPLGEYVTLSQLLLLEAHTFNSADSLKWFVRRNRAALADAGAIIMVAGRMRFHPALFEQSAALIGHATLTAKGVQDAF